LPEIKAAIFDFDGTLVDTYRTGRERLKRHLETHGHTAKPHHWEQAIQRWGQNGPGFLVDCFGMSREEAEAVYNTWEADDAESDIPLIDGAHDAVLWCWENGVVPCMLTSRYRGSLMPILKRANMQNAFYIITAHEDTPHHKPQPEAFNPILECLRIFDIGHTECLLIGDTRFDIEAGQRANIRTLVVETGPYRHGHHLTHPVPETHVVPSIAHFPSWIRSL
jgi:phosphoglycolate phosphatase